MSNLASIPIIFICALPFLFAGWTRASGAEIDHSHLAGATSDDAATRKGSTIEAEVSYAKSPESFDYRELPLTRKMYRQYDIEQQKEFDARKPAYDVVYSPEEIDEQFQNGEKLRVALLEAAKQRGSRFVVEPGIYRFRKPGIVLEGAHDLSIECSGVKFYLDIQGNANEPDGSFTLINFVDCKNISLRGPMEIDTYPLYYSQGEIIDFNSSTGEVNLRILDGYQSNDLPKRARIIHFDRTGSSVHRGRYDGIQPLSPGVVRINLGKRYFTTTLASQTMKEGEFIAFLIGYRPVIQYTNCEDMHLESITGYFGSGLTHQEGTTGLSMNKNIRLLRRPGTSRLVGGQDFQFMPKSGSLVFEDCVNVVGWDDGINMFSHFIFAHSQESAREIYVVPRYQDDELDRSKYEVGATLTFYDAKNFQNRGAGTIVSAERLSDSARVDDLNECAKNLKLRSLRDNRDTVILVTLDNDVNLDGIAYVESSNYRADKFVAKNNYWYDMGSHAILVQGAKESLIRGNLVEKSSRSAFFVGCTQYWAEGPIPRNTVIEDNVIAKNPFDYQRSLHNIEGAIAVSIGLKVAEVGRSDQSVIPGVVIRSNFIVDSAFSAISVENAYDVVIENNVISNPVARIEAAGGEFDLAELSGIYLDAVRNVTVRGNVAINLGKHCQGIVGLGSFQREADVRLEGNTETRSLPFAFPSDQQEEVE